MAIINGKNVPEANGVGLIDYLEANGYNSRYIAIELNEEILPKAKYEDTVLKENDILEIVNFVGGGGR